MSPAPSLFVHVVSYNSESYLEGCLASVAAQQDYVVGDNLIVRLTDNASRDRSIEIGRHTGGDWLQVVSNQDNLGFCGGHNQGVKAFLESDCQFLLILNPDVRLESNCLCRLTRALTADISAGMASARLMRCDAALRALDPAIFDSAGMIMTPSLRHFDRGSGEVDTGQYRDRQYVFGATGACLLLKRECVSDLILEETEVDPALASIYPQLAGNREHRAQLFDEAFFAYREDADLAWRAALYGWKCLYEPDAVAYHKRVVVPERRSSLPPELNKLGVRNRFLLQINNVTRAVGLVSIVEGLLLRNLLVLAGVALREHSSIPALREVFALAPRAYRRRKLILAKSRERSRGMLSIGRWFQRRPFAESLA